MFLPHHENPQLIKKSSVNKSSKPAVTTEEWLELVDYHIAEMKTLHDHRKTFAEHIIVETAKKNEYIPPKLPKAEHKTNADAAASDETPLPDTALETQLSFSRHLRQAQIAMWIVDPDSRRKFRQGIAKWKQADAKQYKVETEAELINQYRALGHRFHDGTLCKMENNVNRHGVEAAAAAANVSVISPPSSSSAAAASSRTTVASNNAAAMSTKQSSSAARASVASANTTASAAAAKPVVQPVARIVTLPQPQRACEYTIPDVAALAQRNDAHVKSACSKKWFFNAASRAEFTSWPRDTDYDHVIQPRRLKALSASRDIRLSRCRDTAPLSPAQDRPLATAAATAMILGQDAAPPHTRALPPAAPSKCQPGRDAAATSTPPQTKSFDTCDVRMARTKLDAREMPPMSGSSRINSRGEMVEKLLHYRAPGNAPAGFVKKQLDDWIDGGQPRSFRYLTPEEAEERARLTREERLRWRAARTRKRERRQQKKQGKTTHRVTKCSCCGVIEHRDKHADNNIMMLGLFILEFGFNARPFFLPEPMNRYNNSSAAVSDKTNSNSNASSTAAAATTSGNSNASSSIATAAGAAASSSATKSRSNNNTTTKSKSGDSTV